MNSEMKRLQKAIVFMASLDVLLLEWTKVNYGKSHSG